MTRGPEIVESLKCYVSATCNLPIDEIDSSESLFHLGFHSLLVVQLISHIEKNYNHRVTVAEFFESPNIDSLAEVISRTIEHAK
jgi:acyl carrier protein